MRSSCGNFFLIGQYLDGARHYTFVGVPISLTLGTNIKKPAKFFDDAYEPIPLDKKQSPSAVTAAEKLSIEFS